MLFFLPKAHSLNLQIKIIVCCFALLAACTGSKKFFKAAEKLEKQGLVNEAAEFYLESLQRKPTNVDARVKLKEVGQKYTSFMASEFFRNYNTGQYDASIENFERMKDFTKRTQALNVVLNYPTAYEDDYKSAVEKYCAKNYDAGLALVKQRKYSESMVYLNNISKYNPDFKKTRDLKTTAVCEPLYQNAISSIEGKNYLQALNHLNLIHKQASSYKDSKELQELCLAQQTKNLLMFEPKFGSNEKNIAEFLFNSFSQTALQNFQTINTINNSPFASLPGNDLGNNVDLIQGIRKASGADYFYTFEVVNKKSNVVGPQASPATCFQKYTYKKNDTLYVTEYKPIKYNYVKVTRNYSYEFKYKLINAKTNQIVNFQTLTMSKQDVVEYNEFTQKPGGRMEDYFPYNPQATSPINQYNPKNWRALFTANKTVKTEPELENLTNSETIKVFEKTLSNYIK